VWTRPAAAFAAFLLVAGTPAVASAAPGDPALTPVAGTGSAGSSGDGGPADKATLNAPFGAAVAPDGTLYVADTGNHKVRAVAPDGTIRTVAGSGQASAAPGQVPAGAKATDIALAGPADLAVGADGTLYIADATAVRVYALAKDGTVKLTVSAQSTASLSPPMGTPTGLAVGKDGTVYVADQQNNRVLAVGPDGTASVAAGNGILTVSAAGGPATQIPIGAPNGLAVDGNGDLWIAGGLLLRRLRAGSVATATQPKAGTWATADGAQWPPADPPFNNVEAAGAGADGPYVFDRQQKAVLRLGAGGAVTTVATLTGADFADLGTIHLAAGAAPRGPVYIVDTGHHRILAARVPAASDPQPKSSGSATWPWLVGGAVLLVLLIIVILVSVGRRRRPGRP
jgi:hypothetical protein